MCTLLHVRVPIRQLALKDTFLEVPRATFKTIRTAEHGTGQPMPFFRATATDLDSMEAALRADTSTESVQNFSSAGERHRLYQIDWQPPISSRFETLVEGDGVLLEARARDGYWNFELLFPDHCAASRTYNRCQDCGIDLTVEEVRNNRESVGFAGDPLFTEQHEALLTAFETDYYCVPRGMTQVELSEQLELSHQALSERLRRGHQALISQTLCKDSI